MHVFYCIGIQQKCFFTCLLLIHVSKTRAGHRPPAWATKRRPSVRVASVRREDAVDATTPRPSTLFPTRQAAAVIRQRSCSLRSVTVSHTGRRGGHEQTLAKPTIDVTLPGKRHVLSSSTCCAAVAADIATLISPSTPRSFSCLSGFVRRTHSAVTHRCGVPP